MPLPASLQTATLTGTYVDYPDTDATPPAGQIHIPMPGRMVYDPPGVPADRCVIVGAPVTVPLSAGTFTTELIRGDNTGLPAFAYTVTETIVGRTTTTKTFTLTGDLDISEVP